MGFLEFLGKKTLIIGEVKSGKTKFTAELIKEAIKLGYKSKIAVVDLAPKIKSFSKEFIGAPLTNYIKINSSIMYLKPEVKAPRIEGKSKKEILRIAEENVKLIEEAFNEFLRNPKEILFINDVSLYLHKGNLNKLFSILSKPETSILNGYYGVYFNNDLGSGISLREKTLMMKLAESMDLIIEMKTFKPLKISLEGLAY
ncbi:MAG: hypothetical protein QXZ53_04835 [Candidatus Bathyarchaeia archaeon]